MTTTIRSATKMERAKSKAMGISALVVVLMLAAAVTFAAIALNMGNSQEPGVDDPPVGEVSARIAFAFPVSGTCTIIKEYSADELQYNATAKVWTGHKAVDIAAELGTPVLATYAGTVTSVVNNAMYGTVVTIQHTDDLKTVYSSLDKNVNVTVGDYVEKGQRIGAVGNTAAVEENDPAHIHLEVYKNGAKVNPADYIDFTAK